MQKKNDKLKDKFEKIIKKDYNNELEKVLEKKYFNENVKNLLLSILYKIETAYRDYETVKQNVEPKEEFIQKIIENIQKNCDEIKLINLNSEEKELLRNKTFLVEKNKKRIICYPMERKLLYSIEKISKQDSIIKEKYFLINETLSDLINIGNNINCIEPMRDFNGYSWDIISREIESIQHNLIYQNLRILIGYKFLNDWIYNKQYIIDYFELLKNELSKQYGEKQKQEFIETLNRLSIFMAIKFNDKLKTKIKRMKQKNDIKLKEIENNEEYIQKLTKEKRKLTKEIKYIDETMNNKYILQEEYEKRNENLELSKKIFSLRILSKMMEEERNEKIEKIEEINRLLNPKNFVKYKKELEENNKVLQLIDTKDIEKNIEEEIFKLQKIFLKCYQIKIKNVQTKQEIIKLIYEYRYYCMLPYNENENIIMQAKIKKDIEKTGKKLIEKAEELKAINILSKQEELNYKLIKNIFKTKIIKLEEINIKITKDKEKAYLQLFDEDIFEEKVEIDDFNKKDLEIKLNKKIKIFN